MIKEKKSVPLSKYGQPEESPGFLLWTVSLAWRRSIETILQSFSLTHPQFVVIATVGWLTQNGESCNQTAIGAVAGFDLNTLSQIMRGLEKKGLIERTMRSNRREKNPFLTSRGSTLLKQVLPAVEEADLQFFKGISPEDRATLERIFRLLIQKEL